MSAGTTATHRSGTFIRSAFSMGDLVPLEVVVVARGRAGEVLHNLGDAGRQGR